MEDSGQSKKRKRFALIITSVAVLLLSTAFTVVFVARITADASADSSVANVRVYLEKLIEATRSSNEVANISKAVQAIEAPVYEDAFLGDALSRKYRSFKELFDESVKKGDDFKKYVDSLASLEVFAGEYQEALAKLESLPDPMQNASTINAEAAYLDAYYKELRAITTLTTSITAPSDFTVEFTEIGAVHHSMEINWEALITSKRLNNPTVYQGSFERYSIAASQLERTTDTLLVYTDHLNEKVANKSKELTSQLEVIKKRTGDI